jgi:hypothetical protein
LFYFIAPRSCFSNKIKLLKSELEKEKKRSNFGNSSKILDEILSSQSSPNNNTGLGYTQDSTSTSQGSVKRPISYANALKGSLRREYNKENMISLNIVPHKHKSIFPTKVINDRKNTSTKRNPPNKYLFIGYCYSCNNFGHKAIHCKAYGQYNNINVQIYKNNRYNTEKRNYNSFTPLQYFNSECQKCNNYGHKTSDCSLQKYDKKTNIPHNKKEWRKKHTECNVALYVRNQECQWYIYSGCSKHMIGDQSKFMKLNKKGKGKLTFGDNMLDKILGKGTIRLRNNKTKEEDVVLVENIKPNLLSVSQTCDQGHILTFDSQKCEIRKNDTGKLVAVAPRTSSNVYILDIEEKGKCCLIQVDESWLWHRRLGHLSFDNLIKANEKEAVRHLPKVIKPSNPICKHCQIGKQTRVRFKTKEHSTTKSS